jgi:hypothetical protein
VSSCCNSSYVSLNWVSFVSFVKNRHSFRICTVKNPMRCNSVSKFYYSLFLSEAQHVSSDTLPIISSLKLRKQPLVLHMWKVVGRVVVGHCQVAACGSAYVKGCWTCGCWTLSGSQVTYATWQRPTTFHVYKTRGCLCSFGLLMMGGVSPETCGALFKNKE